MKTHTTVQQGLEALTHLDHRGATSADALAGDGVGVLTQVPHLFFRKKLEAKGLKLERDSDLAVGVMFLPGAWGGVGGACGRGGG
jgi:glutamate synthase domain-containing protein 1